MDYCSGFITVNLSATVSAEFVEYILHVAKFLKLSS